MRRNGWAVSALVAALAACGGELTEPAPRALSTNATTLAVGYHETPPEGYPTREQLDEMLASANMTSFVPWVTVAARASFDPTSRAWARSTLAGGLGNVFRLHTQGLVMRDSRTIHPPQDRTTTVNGFEIRGSLADGASLGRSLSLRDSVSIPAPQSCGHTMRAIATGDASLRIDAGLAGGGWAELDSDHDSSQDDAAQPACPPPEISLSPSVLSVGGTVQASAECYGLTAAWSSDDPEYATITQSGLVTGIAEGETIIEVSCGGHTSSYPIYVNPAAGSGSVYDAGEDAGCNEEDMGTDDCEYSEECWEGQQWFYYYCGWWGCDWYEEWEWTEIDPEACEDVEDEHLAADDGASLPVPVLIDETPFTRASEAL